MIVTISRERGAALPQGLFPVPAVAAAMELVLVRHAQPLWEPNGRAVDDPDLTELGRVQAEGVARFFHSQSFDHFLVSPTRRSRQTATPLERAWGREAVVYDWLEEIGTPKLEGTPDRAVRKFLQDARDCKLEDWWQGLPGGETFRHFHARIVVGIESFLAEELEVVPTSVPHLWQQRKPRKRILVVSHLGTTSVILSHLLGLHPVPWEWERFPLGWGAHAVVETNPLAEGHLWSLRYFNLDAHLQEG